MLPGYGPAINATRFGGAGSGIIGTAASPSPSGPTPSSRGAGDEELYGCFQFLHALRHHYYGRANKVTPSGRLQTAVVVLLSDALLLCSNRGGLHRYIPLAEVASVTMYLRGRMLVRPVSGASCGSHALLLSFIGCDKLVRQMTLLYSGLCGRDLAVEYAREQPDVASLGLRPHDGAPAPVPVRLVHAVRLASVQAAATAVDKATTHARAASAAGTGGGPAGPLPLPVEVQALARDADDAVPGTATMQPRHATPFFLPRCEAAAAAKVGEPGPSADALKTDPLGICVATLDGGRTVATFPALASLWAYLRVAAAHQPGAQQPPMAQLRYVGCPPPQLSTLAPLATAPTTAANVSGGGGPAAQGLGGCGSAALNASLLRSLLGAYSRQVSHFVTVQRSAVVGGHPVTTQEDGELFWGDL